MRERARRMRRRRQQGAVHISLKPVLIGLAVIVMLLWIKGGEIEAFLRRHEFVGSANAVHAAREALGSASDDVEQEVEQTTDQKRRELRDTARRLLGPDSP